MPNRRMSTPNSVFGKAQARCLAHGGARPVRYTAGLKRHRQLPTLNAATACAGRGVDTGEGARVVRATSQRDGAGDTSWNLTPLATNHRYGYYIAILNDS